MSNTKRRPSWWPLRKSKNVAELNGGSSSPSSNTVSASSQHARTPRSNVSLQELAATASQVPDNERDSPSSYIYDNEESERAAGTLWDTAFEQLRKEKPALISEYEKLLFKELPGSMFPVTTASRAINEKHRQQQLKSIIDKGLERMQQNTWHFRIAGEDYYVKEQVAQATRYALKAKEMIADAVQASPEASTAWAGVCIILPLFTNLVTVEEANSSGLTYVISRMRFYVGLEELRRPMHGYLPDDLRALLEEALVSLYQSVIAFQVQSALRFYSSYVKALLCDMVNWQDWKSMIKTITIKEDIVRQQFADLDNVIIRDSVENLSAEARLNYQAIQDQVSIMTKQLKTADEQLEEMKATNRLIESLPTRLNEALQLSPAKEKLLDIKSTLQLQFPPNKEFVGRREQINTLRKMLTERADYEIAALFGLGGMGKSQVALQLAHEIQRESGGYAVVWVSALSVEAFEKDCVEVLKTLQITHNKDEDAKEIWKRYIISQRDQQWLLIVDNADDLVVLYGSNENTEGVFQFLPRTLNVRILVTTRFRRIASKLANRNIVELLQMTPEEAETFLQRAMDGEKHPGEEDELDEDPQSTDEEARKELLANLSYFPLALSQAVSYMRANDMNIREYLQIFNKADGGAIEWLKNGLGDGDSSSSQDAVATTWFISFEQIRRKEPVITEAILFFIAWIEPKNIPRSLLNTLGSEQEVAGALGTLCGYGFLRKHNRGTMFDMHRLVQLATQLWIEESGEKKSRIRHCTTHFAQIFPNDEWANRALWREYIPHAKKLLDHTPQEHISAVNLSYRIGRCIMADGRPHDSLDLFKNVVAQQKKTLPDDDASLIDSQHLLALAYSESGYVKDAINLMEHVVKVRESYADDNVYRLLSQHELGNMYALDERAGDGIAMLEKVIAIQSKSLPKDDPAFLLSQERLAKAYRINGQVKEAVALQEHVTKIQNDTLVEDDPDRIASEHALAMAYSENGQLEEAVAIWEPLVALATRVFTENSPNVLTMQHALAECYYFNGQKKEAVALLQNVVTGKSEIFAEHHPSLLDAQQALAQTYSMEDEFEEAFILQKHIVAVKEKTLAANDPSLLASQRTLSQLMIFDGDISNALILLKQVVACKSEAVADNDPTLLSYQGELARAYIANRDFENGTALLEQVVEGFGKAAIDENHQGFRLARHWLAMMKDRDK